MRLDRALSSGQLRCGRAFTQIELITVIAVLVGLMGLLVPALATPRHKGNDVTCVNNLRQLIRAWQLYHTENEDRIVMNFSGGDAQNGNAIRNNPMNAPWALGWLDWSTGSDNTNTLFLTDDRYSKLARFLGHSAKVFQCPNDRYVSVAQRLSGWPSRTRSVSANLSVGDGNGPAGAWDRIYKQIRKTSEFNFPGPSETFVYLEEHPDSINDPGFFNPRLSSWIDQPASSHFGAAPFAFADGHTELHKWQSSLASPRAARVKYSNALDARAAVGDPDIHWVSYRAGRVSSESY